ncbi:hypothetical protein BAY61_19700 [Prauserella marina]|uniref:Uncharacterized protein n=1 Tax=Prauserella marina TaxID=530584 RepID=A0A222VSD4_9PSEU|nr:hypothetical protein [Prauserella marina]ASR36846.1 hypothetical protein BAY61_19700 [Prauserella marina]PWV80231.1 hypothetical protein DES30_103322 [Prauserella marina]SDD49901.1 hypothetical protein SAMN05421630_109107 [Prauserella marina]
MADTENTQDAKDSTDTAPSRAQLAAARAFVAEHGKPSRAVVERIGRAGARVVLVGADGALGDVVVPSEETGAALVEAVDDLEAATWDADTVNSTSIGAAHRRKMAGPLAKR